MYAKDLSPVEGGSRPERWCLGMLQPPDPACNRRDESKLQALMGAKDL
jgi:hypothetical protein